MEGQSQAAGWLRPLLASLHGRAVGLWRFEGDHLVQVAFVPSNDLPPDVARRFAEATAALAVSRTDLGVVRAFLEADVVVSRASKLPDGAGSGYWLRQFGAERSVAVAVGTAVISVALGSDGPGDVEVARTLREAALARGLDRIG